MSVTVHGIVDIKTSQEDDSDSITLTYLVKRTSVADTLIDARLAVAAEDPPSGYILKRLTGGFEEDSPDFFRIDAECVVPQDEEENPLDRPSKIAVLYDEKEIPYFIDSEGELVITSSHERPQELPTRRDGSMILQITKNLPTLPVVAYDELKHTRNDEEITIKGTTYAAKTLLLLPVNATEEREKVAGLWVTYFATTFRLSADHLIHEHTFEDRGFYELVGGVQKQILVNRAPPTTPWPLDGSGEKKANAYDAPELITRKPYPVVSWGLDFS